MERVVIRKIKLPDGAGLMGAYRVRDDEFGTWFFTPATSSIAWTNVPGKATAWEHDVLYLSPKNDWYFVLWWNGHPTVEIGVDVTAPATWDGNVLSWVDLEIDLHRFVDGRVEIEDEDEFEDSVAKGYISDHQRDNALRVTPIVERMLRERIEPFGDVGRRILEETVLLDLDPV